jgi:hypothetical protein
MVFVNQSAAYSLINTPSISQEGICCMEFISWGSLRNLSNNLTTCDSLLLEKLVVAQPTKKPSPFYGTYRLFALFTTVCTWIFIPDTL